MEKVKNGFVDFHTAYSAAIYGLTAHQASRSYAKFRLCIVHCIVLVLKILNSISCLVSLFSVLHADSKNGTQHVSWPLTVFTKLEKLKIWYFFHLSKRSNAKICIRGKDYFVNCKQNPRARSISILYFWETWHGLVSWKQNIGQSDVKLSLNLRHFHKNIRSCVENECCCLRTVSISNISPEPIFKYMGQQMSGPDSSNDQCIRHESEGWWFESP